MEQAITATDFTQSPWNRMRSTIELRSYIENKFSSLSDVDLEA